MPHALPSGYPRFIDLGAGSSTATDMFVRDVCTGWTAESILQHLDSPPHRLGRRLLADD